jgi:hypothetical protein
MNQSVLTRMEFEFIKYGLYSKKAQIFSFADNNLSGSFLGWSCRYGDHEIWTIHDEGPNFLTFLKSILIDPQIVGLASLRIGILLKRATTVPKILKDSLLVGF